MTDGRNDVMPKRVIMTNDGRQFGLQRNDGGGDTVSVGFLVILPRQRCRAAKQDVTPDMHNVLMLYDA